MPLDRRTVSTLDTDTAPERVAAGRAAYLRNVQVERGYVRTVRGNRALAVVLPSTGISTVVGAAELPGTRGGWVSLVHNSGGQHCVVRQLPPAAPVVLLNWAGLNLPAPGPQTYLACTVVDTFLCYLDADGEARNLPLDRLAAGEYPGARLDLEPYCLHVVKEPPTAVLLGVARVVVAPTEPLAALKLVQQKAWQFTYRWQYVDGEVTVLAPFSAWADVVEPPATALASAIEMTLPRAPAGVSAVDVLVRSAGQVGWTVAETLRRQDDGTLPGTYRFYGLSTGGTVQGDDATRPYEFLWPARALTAARNRLWYGNTRVGYPTPAPAFTADPMATFSYAADQVTFHESSTYRVVVQFYDALGRPGGCSAPVVVAIPAQDPASNLPLHYAIAVNLRTTDPAALNVEIPAWAASYQFLVARNDRTTYFLQGLAADCLAYVGQERRTRADGTVVELATLKPADTPHERLRVDIGNWPAVGLGYVWQAGSGDTLKFLGEAGRPELLITGQYGDYVEVQWNGHPVAGTGRTHRIEIFTPNRTSSAVYYERGPRLPVMRAGAGADEQRSYSATALTLYGDCYLAELAFPVLQSDGYEPPDKKLYVDNPAGRTIVESMVPPFRLTPNSVTTTLTKEVKVKNSIFDGGLFGLISDSADTIEQTGTSTAADTATRTAANLLWLDMSYGGRPGTRIPRALQQVDLPGVFGYSGVRNGGSLLNGLSTWQAADQREIAREQGPIMALAPADDVQSEDSILVALCAQGTSSIGIGVARVRQADGGSISADTSQVVGYVNAKKGGWGTRHPGSLARRAGHLYWWDEERAQFCRYAQDGVNGLNDQHQCRALGQALAAAYGNAPVVGGYDLFTDEYVLAFGPDPVSGAPAVTHRFSERVEGFVGTAGYAPQFLLGTGQERFLAFAAGQAWEHVEGIPRMQFFGAPAAGVEVRAWFNENSPASKTFLGVTLETGALAWDVSRAENISGQWSLVPPGRLEFQEDKYYGPLLLDATSPGFTGPDAQRRALYEGVPLQGLAVLLTLRASNTTDAVRLVAAGVDYFINGGQTPPQ